MNKYHIILILFIALFSFSCEKRYSQSELIEQNIFMSEIEESTSEIIINGITSFVIKKPGTVYKRADLYKLPSDDSELYYFYDKIFVRNGPIVPVFKDELLCSLKDDRDLYILGMTKKYDLIPWYYVRFFNTEGTFEAWIKGDSLIVESF